jgi:putative oxidoreductase
MLTSAGMPAFLALGVYVGEVIAPLLMVLGITCRLASLVVAFNMLVAIFLGHSGDLLSLNQYGGWAIELPVLYFVGALCVALLGPGDYVAWKGKGILE